MADQRESPILFFAPFVSSAMRIEPAWIDYNGHLNMAYYHVLFDRALDEAYALLGLGEDYHAMRQGSTFAVENHILYKRELTLADTVRVTIQLVNYDEKRMHFYKEIHEATEGWLSAASESMSVHVDSQTRKVASFPPDILANLAVMKAAHGRLPASGYIGRTISMNPRQRMQAGQTLN